MGLTVKKNRKVEECYAVAVHNGKHVQYIGYRGIDDLLRSLEDLKQYTPIEHIYEGKVSKNNVPSLECKDPNEPITLTEELLNLGMNNNCGISHKQLEILGINPKKNHKGWRILVTGKIYPRKTIIAFLLARKR